MSDAQERDLFIDIEGPESIAKLLEERATRYEKKGGEAQDAAHEFAKLAERDFKRAAILRRAVAAIRAEAATPVRTNADTYRRLGVLEPKARAHSITPNLKHGHCENE